MTAWPRSHSQEKITVRILISEMLGSLNLSWNDMLSKERSHLHLEARMRASTMAFEYLHPFMSEPEIAEWMGMSRSTVRSCRKRWNRKHGTK